MVMCMYRGSRIGVVYENNEFLDKWFKDFLSKIDTTCISSIRKSGVEDILVLLKDGTTIQSIRMSESSRGNALDKIYVDPDVDIKSDIFQYVIKPLLKNPKIIIEREYKK